MTDKPEGQSMIERVARAICSANWGPLMSEDEITCQVENGWDLWEREARAAIEAMRDPTPAMLGGAAAALRGASFADYPEKQDAAIWRAMIDAILSDPPGSAEG